MHSNNIQPNFENIVKVLKCEKTDRPVLFEFLIDPDLLRKYAKQFGQAENGTLQYHAMVIEGYKTLGYDFAPIFAWETNTLQFYHKEHASKASHSQNEGAVITDRQSFEAYQWPNPQQGDYSPYEKLKDYLPDGMKLLGCSYGGLLENTMDICGFENLCMMMMMDPELTREIFDHIGERLYQYYKIISAFDTVGACMVNDDWGFKTQTMLQPEMMKKYVFPWTKKIVQVIHENGKPVIQHSCGNLKAVMDDIIDDIKIDGKHSFEDGIYPVEEAYDWWHDRVAIIGGLDVDFLCRETPENVKKRAIKLLEKTSDKGGYALGAGNSVTPYMPEENYLAMISAAKVFSE